MGSDIDGVISGMNGADAQSGFVGMWTETSGPTKGRMMSRYTCSWGQETGQVAPAGMRLIPGDFDPATVYFEEADSEKPTPTERPLALVSSQHKIFANGNDVLTVKLPTGTSVRKNNAILGEVGEEQTFEFVTAYAGQHEFDIRPPFPYQRQTLTVIAT